jgi:hypothetical protein
MERYGFSVNSSMFENHGNFLRCMHLYRTGDYSGYRRIDMRICRRLGDWIRTHVKCTRASERNRSRVHFLRMNCSKYIEFNCDRITSGCSSILEAVRTCSETT